MVKCVANVTEIVEVVFGTMGKGKAKKIKRVACNTRRKLSGTFPQKMIIEVVGAIDDDP